MNFKEPFTQMEVSARSVSGSVSTNIVLTQLLKQTLVKNIIRKILQHRYVLGEVDYKDEKEIEHTQSQATFMKLDQMV